jgi:acetolactate synthase I/III small subunit
MNRYTILIYTENFIGILNRITIIFTRRGINIDALTASESRLDGIHKITIECAVTEEQIIHLLKQIEKITDVIKAYFFLDSEVVYQEIALYKLPIESLEASLEKVIRQYNAHIIAAEKDFVVIEFTGHKENTQALLETLKPYNLLEFSRSGRVAIAKPKFSVSAYLNNQTL